MCGIAGYIGKRYISDETIRHCHGVMHHRGPDGKGSSRFVDVAGNHVVLLHTRLAIIDLDERAAQPFSEEGSSLVFNGELYNYRELRKALADTCDFRTASDTEVLAKTLRSEGFKGLDRCEGMWALAYYNEQTSTLTLSRDRFGEKPLYLYEDSTGLYFASEVKFITALTGKRLTPNISQIKRFLINGYRFIHKGTDTFHQGVTELPAASALTIGPDMRQSLERYWQPTFEQDEAMTFDQAVQGVRERLIRSVELRLRADVPLAFCMSGGVDSNALISIAKNVFDYDVHGFTVMNTDERYAEGHLVQQAVREQGLKHTPVPLDTADFLDNMKRLVAKHDAPVYTISYYTHWMLMRSVTEQGYKISISGTAADELFTGYYDHYLMYLAALTGTEHEAEAIANWRQHIAPIVRNPLLQDPSAFINNPGQREHTTLGADVFASYMHNGEVELFTEDDYGTELLRNRMLNELFSEVIPVILHEDDVNAMSYSIENRSPFLDRDLFEFCQNIPTRHLMRDGYNKAILREAIRGIAPDCIVDERRKVGFNAPIFDLLDTNDPEVCKELLNDGPIYEYVSKEAISAMLAQPTLSNSDSKFLFSLIGCKYFLELANDTTI